MIFRTEPSRMTAAWGAWLLVLTTPLAVTAEKSISPLDRYIAEMRGSSVAPAQDNGSLWSSGAPLAELGRDLRAWRQHDLLTIIVFDRASATAAGTTNASRQSQTSAGISAAYGATKLPLAQLAGANADTSLQGEGTTSRSLVLSTTLTARVTHVLPNGDLVVEGTKQTEVNSELQSVTIRGVVRPVDITALNQVRSDRLAFLEVKINGKGVVGDAVRRPFFLYRILLGLLPF